MEFQDEILKVYAQEEDADDIVGDDDADDLELDEDEEEAEEDIETDI